MVCDLAVVSTMLNPQKRHTGGNAQLQALRGMLPAWCGVA